MKSLSDFGPLPEVIEDGSTFDENAYKKAHHYAKVLGIPAIADDSGLVVDALSGAGLALGVDENWKYDDYSRKIEPGQIVLLTTDGNGEPEQLTTDGQGMRYQPNWSPAPALEAFR